jgi:hypothetical protein
MNHYQQLADLINLIVNSPGGWKEKATKVKEEVDETNLAEFLSWFEESGE